MIHAPLFDPGTIKEKLIITAISQDCLEVSAHMVVPGDSMVIVVTENFYVDIYRGEGLQYAKGLLRLFKASYPDGGLIFGYDIMCKLLSSLIVNNNY